MKRFVWPLLFLSAAAFTAPGLARIIRQTIELAPLAMDERRARILGDDYRATRELARVLPENDNIALFTADYGGPVDRAIFVNYYLFPRATKIYVKQLVTLAPRTTIVVPRSGPIRRTFNPDPKPYSAPMTDFIVPFAAAVDALDPYTTEMVIEAERPTRVTLTLMPSAAAKTHAIAPGRPLILGDVVFQSLGTKGIAWLRVHADAPVRAGVWFVNRGGAQSWPIALLTDLPPLPQRIAGGEKLWVINTADADVPLRVNGYDESLRPREIRSYGAQPVNTIEGNAPVFAFATQKIVETGNTRFLWPEGVR
jgi:hypothetical protein